MPAGSGIFAGLTSRATHTASMTSFTAAGGFLNDCTSLISSFLMVSSASMAAFSAGIASARRSSHSFFTAPASSPFLEAAATSISTAAFLGSTTSAFSRLTFSISSSVSATVLIRLGLSAVSSSCIVFTASAVNASFSRPTSYRFFAELTTSRWRVSNDVNIVRSSRYDVGVT